MESYGAVSFSGDTRAGPFYEQIHSGRKTLTLRKRRKDERPHVKPGYSFAMYWEVRKKKETKPIHYIGRAECVAYEAVRIVDRWNDEEFAKSDGFQDLEEFRDNWFPAWRNMPGLDEMIKAYRRPVNLVDSRFRDWGSRRQGKSTLAKFLRLEYMMIQWKYPLIEVGKYQGKEGEK